jgi:hypothetical protein
MSKELIIYKDRTNLVPLNLGIDVSSDVITSQIRVEPNQTSMLLAEWDVSFDTDGTNGKIILRIEPEQLSGITRKYGYMDLKRVSAGHALSVFREPLKVAFKEVVTV